MSLRLDDESRLLRSVTPEAGAKIPDCGFCRHDSGRASEE
jgi:hypothetical protein